MTSLRPFTRREVLRIGSLSLALGSWSRAVDLPDGAFEFVVVNDTHYIGEACKPWHIAVASAMRESAPGALFCVNAGDVTDAGDAAACTAVKEIYGQRWKRLYTVPGNHDYISDVDRSGYDGAFAGKLNYVFEEGAWQFVALDTTQGTLFDATDISAVTLEWLEETAAKLNRDAPTFVFTHFPLGIGSEYRPRNADALIQRLTPLNVKWIHNGHWHGESIRKARAFTASTSRCCARLRGNRDKSPLKGWHVYRAEADGKLSRRFVEAPKV